MSAPNLAPQALRIGSALEGAERTVAVWGGAGPFDFKGNVPRAFQRADVWFDDMKIPEARSYRDEVFMYPVGRKYQAGDSVGSLTVWKGHVGIDGKKHHNTANMFIPVTEPLKKIAAANPEKELTVTGVVTPIAQAPRPKSTPAPAAQPVEDEIQFKSVRVILDGGGPFAKAGGKHGH